MPWSEEEPLFYVESEPVKVPTRKEAASASRPRWSKYRPKNPVKCDDCMLLLALSKGQAPASMPARWKRQLNGSSLVLCYGHAAARQDQDGLERL